MIDVTMTAVGRDGHEAAILAGLIRFLVFVDREEIMIARGASQAEARS